MAQARGEMRKRMVLTDVDSILRIFKDYLGDAIPADAMPDALVQNPKTGLLGLKVSGNSWVGDKGEVRVDFQVKRFTPIGGN